MSLAVAAQVERRESPTNRRRDIQGLRAVAVLAVIAYHAGLPVPGGFLGVDVFFVISGFVITGLLSREYKRSATVALRQFYKRRFLRLTPALATTVLVTAMLSALIQSPLGGQQVAAQTGLGAMFLCANVVITVLSGGYFDAPAEANPLLNTWSLSVEEQFYLAFPLLLLLVWRWRRTSQWATGLTVLAVTGVSFTLAVAGSSGMIPVQLNSVFGFYSPVTRAWEFGVGALIALFPFHANKRARTLMAFLGIVLVAASLWGLSSSTPTPSGWTLLPVVGTALLLVSGRSANPVSRLLSLGAMVTIGDLSYSLYLWHWPFIVFARDLFPTISWVPVLAAIVSVLPAVFSYRRIETAFRSKTQMGRSAFARLVGVTILVPASACLLLFVSANHFWWNPTLRGLAAQQSQMPAGYSRGCAFNLQSDTSSPTPCRWNDQASGTPVYLLGDSNAAHFTEALEEATKRSGSPLTVTTAAACPLLKLTVSQAGTPAQAERNCAAQVERTLSWIEKQPPGVVFIGISEDYWLDPTWQVRLPSGELVEGESSKTASMETALSETVNRIQNSGQRVVLIRSVPHFTADYAWNESSISPLSLMTHSLGQSLPLTWWKGRTVGVSDAMQRVATNTGASVMDLSSSICPGDTCSTVDGAVAVYRDGTHITVGRSIGLAQEFLNEIRSVTRSAANPGTGQESTGTALQGTS